MMTLMGSNGHTVLHDRPPIGHAAAALSFRYYSTSHYAISAAIGAFDHQSSGSPCFVVTSMSYPLHAALAIKPQSTLSTAPFLLAAERLTASAAIRWRSNSPALPAARCAHDSALLFSANYAIISISFYREKFEFAC
jgi:hypothetical protein